MSSQIDLEVLSPIELRRSAKALITAADRVLLIRERHADGATFWTLPGGGLCANETYQDALSRELAEELLCRATIDDPLTELWYAHKSTSNKVSRCRVFRCTPLSSMRPNLVEGVLEHRWVRPNDLPPDTLLPIRYLIENRVTDAMSTP